MVSCPAWYKGLMTSEVAGLEISTLSIIVFTTYRIDLDYKLAS